jgi:lycopene cyclase domain-containing protein
VSHLAYLGVLAACLAGSAWLEVVLHTRVFRRPVRLALAIAPVLVVFLVWDYYAIGRHQWTFDPARVTGVHVLGKLPLEELLFFIVIPICSILAFEAVRRVRGWPAGDERDDPDETGGPHGPIESPRTNVRGTPDQP